jgi:hypothetical protein
MRGIGLGMNIKNKRTTTTIDEGNVAPSSHKSYNQEWPELDLIVATRLWGLRRVRPAALNGQKRCATSESSSQNGEAPGEERHAWSHRELSCFVSPKVPSQEDCLDPKLVSGRNSRPLLEIVMAMRDMRASWQNQVRMDV